MGASKAKLQPLEIIYIDDEPDIAEMFFDAYNSCDYNVKVFTDPYEGLAAIQTDRPDIVFIDFRMPEINGDELAKKISHPLIKVLVTGDLEVNTVSHFDHKLTKPHPWNTIDELLKELLERKRNQ